MKIITLNTWGGKVGAKALLPFFKKHKDVDIFCLQEIYHKAHNVPLEYENDMLNIFSDIQKILTGHIGYFRPSIETYGIALFINKKIDVIDEGEIVIHPVPNYDHVYHGSNHPRNLQYVHFIKDSKEYAVANIHGPWNGLGKTDTEERMKQSTIIRQYIDSVKGLKIICGDFNLRPDTQSITIIEKGMRNLIKEYNIASTRTDLYKKPEKYADYIFISPEIKVKNFAVLPDQISDHSPLLLEI